MASSGGVEDTVESSVVYRSGGGTSCCFSTPLIGRVRAVSGDHGGCSEPRPLCPDPHLYLYIALCDRGPPTSGWLSIPDQDVVKRSDWPLGKLVEIKLTLMS